MSAVIGFSLQRFIDPNAGTGGSSYYYRLGCGDIVYGTTNNDTPSPPCPLHGAQSVLGTSAVIIDGTSERDPS
jgi:hypothetical protein